MRVWLDADACPRDVKDIVFRASSKRRFPVVLVANRPQVLPRSNLITQVSVSGELDAADAYIVQEAVPGELVVTQDIPLAAELVEKGVATMSPRGEVWTLENIRERLSVRDFMTEARASGVTTGGPAPYDEKAKRAFANAFDRWLAKAKL